MNRTRTFLTSRFERSRQTPGIRIADISLYYAFTLYMLLWEVPSNGILIVREKYIEPILERRRLQRGRPTLKHRKRKGRALTPQPAPASRSLLKKASQQSSQPDSRLLSELPWEIRAMIWKECLTGMTFHLGKFSRDENHLSFIVCYSKEPSNPRWCPHSCWRQWYVYQPGSTQRRALSFYAMPPKPPILPLLQSCRQTYSECIDMVYSSNTFDTSVSNCTLLLPRFILPQRFDTIQNLRFDWYIPFLSNSALSPLDANSTDVAYSRNFRNWAKTWYCLASMKSLRNLFVKLRFFGVLSYWRHPEAAFLEPILEITTPKVFEIVLPFWMVDMRINLDDTVWGNLPCSVTISDDAFYDRTGNSMRRFIKSCL
ncbi:hypothetical protein BJ875DRAFT_276201 [Amylocarpus encephaloides]|uniref:DUF7730 domain-containing protein n=1 Tax=Amylocarpus encephaloides TaxID=45428 RepID=A0A9P7YTM0_9HELO|nr:hypothetical protein BJ875DRAFT_276201 [Amylocarpus encephaloides]